MLLIIKRMKLLQSTCQTAVLEVRYSQITSQGMFQIHALWPFQKWTETVCQNSGHAWDYPIILTYAKIQSRRHSFFRQVIGACSLEILYSTSLLPNFQGGLAETGSHSSHCHDVRLQMVMLWRNESADILTF